ncbi:glycosyltransferase family 2 protein [bacterium]|nr:glycosyltransferase family 2 protein [bacterium]
MEGANRLVVESTRFSDEYEFEVSVVMPCLNEEQTVGICIRKAKETMEKLGIHGEVVISDNGSTDRSVELSEELGARVVHQPEKGYGNAYIKGLAEARGKFIVMADSDDSYDLTDLERFIKPLRDGYDMVMGSRLKGEIKPGAMKGLHRLGNPFLSGFMNLVYRTGMSDAHCGMRAFTKQALQKMHLRTAGMEFASEMVIKAAKAKLKMTEIPITLHPDGRNRPPHLNTFRDGWRHLRFILMYSPKHLFGYFGTVLFLAGAALFATYLFDRTGILEGFLGAMMTLTGWMINRFGFYGRAHQFTLAFPDWDLPLQRHFKRFHLERSLIMGVLRFIVGIILLIGAFSVPAEFFERIILLGSLVTLFGLLTVFDAFLTRILQFEGLK